MATIHDAALLCDVEALRRELERGVDPNIRAAGPAGFYNQTPLQWLPLRDHSNDAQMLQCCRLLIESGADVSVRDVLEDTLLHDACLWDQVAIAELLLEAGADIEARGLYENTPLHRAVLDGGVECTNVLLRAGAEVNARNEHGHTPLEYAIDENPAFNVCQGVYPLLLRAGSELPAETDDPYIQKVIDAGGWANYQRLHLDKLTAMLTPKDDGRRRSRRRLSPLRRVPQEVLRKIAAFAFHAGYY